ncbi:MAG TPA: dihydroorotase [Niabella sp.]|nr:dihydroorotase [Niabella sp.]HOZ95854.1 dihydroorotase [Niabella sp.]HQW13708.1 dihydroorotase [Niabella sp.]HQX19102.1 dihydroorotase [Niabella sp.]HQX41265.1 dihydroorotase [Niabella sp.]
MNILIKQAKVVDPTSPYNGQISDIHLSNNRIVSIGKKLSVNNAKEINIKGLHVSPGWFDLFSDFADPGYEYRENLYTGVKAAIRGGYTDVCLIPNTRPVIDQKSFVEYLKNKAAGLAVNLHPMGAITKAVEGKELAEMYDMKQSGAIAFSDGVHPIQSAGLLVKALQYVKSFNGVLIQIPDNMSINPNGVMNEGITSTRMGLPGRPTIAEELAVVECINLTAYADSKIHLTGVSTDASLKQIKAARQKKINITSSVTPYHLVLCDENISTYDANLKVNPPLRGKKDQTALRKAVSEGLVDCIASHHIPQDKDNKVVEFEYAKNGMIGLETTYSIVNTAMPEVSQERWIELLAINPRKVMGLDVPTIAEGSLASLTLFSPDESWTLHENEIASLSHNSPFIGKTFKGKALGIINNNQLILNN